MGRTDRGQSELLGFALIFGLIVFAILLLLTVGAAGLDHARDYQRSTNAEQAYFGLASNVDDVTRAGAPSRSTEFRLADATLLVGENETIRVRVEPVDPNGGETLVLTVQTAPIMYDSGAGTELVYSTGLIARYDDGSGVILREPRFVLTDEAVILPIVSTRADPPFTVGGSPILDIHTTRGGIDDRWVRTTPQTVSIEVMSPHAELWFRYFDAQPEASCTLSGDVVTCELQSDRVAVTTYAVNVTQG